MSTNSRRILIVDDDRINRSILLDILKEKYFISMAQNGPQALTKAQSYEDRPDIILLDIVMPGMDGFETCQRLKASDTTRDIPVIFITAMHDQVGQEKGMEVGGVDYILKPFDRQDILNRIKQNLIRYN